MSIQVREVVRKRPNRVVYEARVGSAPGVLCGTWKIWGVGVRWIGSSMVSIRRDQSAQLEFPAPPRAPTSAICITETRNVGSQATWPLLKNTRYSTQESVH